MVQYCVAPGCKSNARTPGISFHRFPKDETLRKLWLIRIRRDEKKNVKVSSFMRICSNHFLPEDIYISKNGKLRMLKSDAVPHFSMSSQQRNTIKLLDRKKLNVKDSPGTSKSVSTLNSLDEASRISKAMDFPPPFVLKDAIENRFKSPVIFKNCLISWMHVPSTVEQLSTQYGDILLNFRLVSKSNESISWEGSAEYIQARINQFIEWHEAKDSKVHSNNPFHKYMEQDFWAYSSYNYMSRTFNEDADILKAVNWSALGYPETSGIDGAFWIGSKDSYTPCHFDTYGFNIVTQIQGRKKWILFPPEDTPFMYPTRIPYEESSVFSSVNILNPDLKKHPLFQFSHPYEVVLQPGDILFVPNKWWHFVQSLDMTVSINTWIEKDTDKDSHLEEAVTRALMTSYISFFEPIGESWINPNEELVFPEETLKYVTQELSKFRNSKTENTVKDDSVSPNEKTMKLVQESDVHSNISDNPIQTLVKHSDISYLKPEIFSNWYGKSIDKLPASNQDVNIKNIVDCFAHPEVISVICKLLKRI